MTTSCKEMYKLMGELHEELIERKETKLEKMLMRIENAFCDFECGWQEHLDESHGGRAPEK